MEVPKIVVFNGVEYRLMGSGRYYLSQSRTNEGRRHAKGLHVAVWEFYTGQTVPPGHEIHHKDGDTFNNDISNLECVPMREHRKMYRLSDPEKQIQHLKRIRGLAKDWHSSEEGHEWHKAHVAESLGKIKPRDCVCEQCGTTFQSRNYTYARFCSHNCAVAWDYHNKAKTERRVCEICGSEFDAVVHPGRDGARTCSRVCRARLTANRHYTKTGRPELGSTREKLCAVCGKRFEFVVTNQSREGPETCGRSCSAKLRWQRRKSE